MAILAGLPHLQDISRSSHPIDQDEILAEAWGREQWADYSGVSRTLQQLSQKEVKELCQVLDEIEAPFLEQEIEIAMSQKGYLVFDGDLTGRPISSTSTTYPDAAFGYMGDRISLGYQAALVTIHSPTYGRLWLNNTLHSGDTVSATELKEMVRAAEIGVNGPSLSSYRMG